MRRKHPWIKVACLLPFTVTLSVLQFIQASLSFPFPHYASLGLHFQPLRPLFILVSHSITSLSLYLCLSIFLSIHLSHTPKSKRQISASLSLDNHQHLRKYKDITCNFTEATNIKQLLLVTYYIHKYSGIITDLMSFLFP